MITDVVFGAGAGDGVGGRSAAAGVGHRGGRVDHRGGRVDHRGGRVEPQQRGRGGSERAARNEARVEPLHSAGPAATPRGRAGRPGARRADRARQLRPRLQGCALCDVRIYGFLVIADGQLKPSPGGQSMNSVMFAKGPKKSVGWRGGQVGERGAVLGHSAMKTSSAGPTR